MADAELLVVGAPWEPDGGTVAFTNFALDGNTDLVEWIFQAPAAITISKLGFRYGVRAGTPPTYQISLQGVGTDGNPDGTIKGATNNALKAFTPPADATWNSTWQWLTLDETATVARGDMLAIVIAYSSGTVDGSNNSSFTTHASIGGSRQGHPYATQNAAGVRTRSTSMPIYGYTSASATYGRPLETITATAYNSGSSPNEYGLRFTIPTTWCSTFKVVGIRWFGLTGGAGDSYDVELYDADGDPGTVLQSVTIDWDYNTAVGGSSRMQELYFNEATLSTLNAGSTYHVGLTANDAANGMAVHRLTVDAAGDWEAWPGGQHFADATRAGAGWTSVAAIRPLIHLILDDITAPTASGGSHVIF